jgi:NAD(P)-dependent dehydrogenase (short-subunit alcohol dehydrogenase family)
MKSKMRSNNKPQTILITGASTGIGLYLASYLAENGNLVYAGARKDGDIAELSKIQNVIGIKLDVTNEEEVSSAKEMILQKSDHIDVLVNNAGIVGWGAVIDRDLEYYKSVFEVNLFGSIQMVKTFYPLLKASPNKPIIINVSSQGGSYTFPFWTPYSMTKYALESFSEGLRRELHSQGIRVSVIKPGAITSKAFEKQTNSFEAYKENYDSVFSNSAAKFFRMALERPAKKEKSPILVAKDIEHAIFSKKSRRYYHPGRRLTPDIIASKLPLRIVDRIIEKMLNAL